MVEKEGENIRSFIAIEMPPHIIDRAVSIQEKLGRNIKSIRWVRREGIHLTLKFLGDIRPDDTEILGELLEPACRQHVPFDLTLDGLGAFPDMKRPRVLWLGLEGELDRLNYLWADVEKACKEAGFAEEKRRFSPHLTLGRVKDGRIKKEDLAGLMNAMSFDSSESFRVDALYLYESKLRPQGAIYTKLKTFPLGGE